MVVKANTLFLKIKRMQIYLVTWSQFTVLYHATYVSASASSKSNQAGVPRNKTKQKRRRHYLMNVDIETRKTRQEILEWYISSRTKNL